MFLKPETSSLPKKLPRILRSKAVNTLPVHVGETVQFLVKDGKKCGKWSAAKTVLLYDQESGTLVVSGSQYRKIHAAVEEFLSPVDADELARLVQESPDQTDMAFDDCMEELDNSEQV